MTSIQKLLCFIAGAKKEVLYRNEVKSASVNLSLIGTFILLTGVFATISGSYVVYSIFEDTIISILIGLLWGVLIITIDRFIIVSLKKIRSVENKKQDKLLVLLNALPRIILAVFIGFLVAIPLELKIVENRLLVEMNDKINQRDSIRKANNKTLIRADYVMPIEQKENDLMNMKDTDPEDVDILESSKATKVNEIKIRQKQINNHEYNVNNLRKQMMVVNLRLANLKTQQQDSTVIKKMQALNGEYNKVRRQILRLKGYIAGQNELKAEVEADLAEIQAEIDEKFAIHQRKQDEVKEEIVGLKADKKTEKQRMRKISSDARVLDLRNQTLVERFATLSALKEKDAGIRRLGWSLSLLFIMIEAFPILVKLLSPANLYDRAQFIYDEKKSAELIDNLKNESKNPIVFIAQESDKENLSLILTVLKESFERKVRANPDNVDELLVKYESQREAIIDKYKKSRVAEEELFRQGA